ncbi:FAD-dependent oxidoreductase, partial [Anaplasma bovis]|uniref:FAD-dependent oxidoreductase n=1 Tax=Anaplasma bovis TaxID=186733 RepID=UPI002FEEB1E5
MLNVSLDDLYSMDGLKKLDLLFLEDVKKHSDSLLESTIQARNAKIGSTEIMLELAFVLEKFIVKLFGVEKEVEQLSVVHEQFSSIYKCKRNFVHRYALRKYSNPADLNIEEITSGLANFMSMPIDESTFAHQVNEWMQNPEQYESEIDAAAKYAAYMTHADNKSILFQVPEKYDVENLVPIENTQLSCSIDAKIIRPKLEKIRMGFNVATQPSENYALNEVHYCIVCHKQNRDSCSKGMQDKSGGFKASPLGVAMTGCPLKVKISEVNLLRSQGLVIAPLAVVVIDNPMCALTGHRICNDCSRACIYQKQQQVDIPSIETHILDSVLNLSYGFEIYSLFTRWNPLAFANVLPQTPTNKNVLVVGLGPAGIGLSHYLLNEGHNVVAIDGLKIDPLPENLSGVTKCGKKQRFSLIKDVKTELFEHLDYRTSYGFGGVAEYGITARWNKNYLKVARLLLERRDNFAMYGGVMLGSTLSVADALSFGFHHVALATGAGAPRIPDIKNVLAKGVLTASSFLMSLHLGNAPHTDSVTNLQIRFPCVVIGGGLTAVDTATELLAYYPVQVEKFLSRYEEVTEKYGKSVEDEWDAEERKIFGEFISHAQQIREEKKRAKAENRIPNILGLLKQWNGVTIVYRGSFNSSPAYRINSEELRYAMSEGIYFAENLQLHKIAIDEHNHASGVVAIDSNGEEKFIPAKCIVIAVGTCENSVIFEDDTLKQDLIQKAPCQLQDILKDEESFFVSPKNTVSAFGDLHPHYRGSVVKAIASAKNGYLAISEKLADYKQCEDNTKFFETIRKLFHSSVVSVVPIADCTAEITIHSPLASKKFNPG